MGFEACDNLYRFCRLPFDFTNGVPCFQQKMDDINNKEQTFGIFAYVNNIVICSCDSKAYD